MHLLENNQFCIFGWAPRAHELGLTGWAGFQQKRWRTFLAEGTWARKRPGRTNRARGAVSVTNYRAAGACCRVQQAFVWIGLATERGTFVIMLQRGSQRPESVDVLLEKLCFCRFGK